MAQTRLRPGDMLARTGGDEFCVVLPASTLREGAMIARRIVDDVPRGRRSNASAPISRFRFRSAWRNGPAEMGAFPDRLIAAADHALYAAKKDGRNCHAVYEPVAAAGAGL